MTLYTRQIEVSGTTFTAFEVDAVFDITTETSLAEPYSWGGSRGKETVATGWELLYLNMDGFRVSREQVAQWIGNDAVKAYENEACEAYLEELG